MKTVLLAALLLATPAFAAAPQVENLDEAVYACTEGENHDGEKISEADSKAACVDAVDMLLKLSQSGYCLNADGDWAMCRQ